MGANGWLRLELRYLAALEAIAASGSFGGAADRLGYTQSAVSQQIAAFERLVGQPLIDRPGGRRPVGLTEAGSLLLEHSEAVLARLRMAQAQLEALGQGEAGTLRVGTYQSVGIRVLPGVAARVAETHPDLRLEIHEAGCDLELRERVQHGELDVTFCVLPAPEDPLTTEDLLEDPYRLLVPAASPLLEGGEVPLETLGSLPLIGYRGCRIEERVFSYLRGLGIDVKRVAYAGDNAIIQAMVGAGRGVALLTELSIDESDPQTATLKLADWIPRRRVGLAWHAGQASSPALEAFLEAAREVTRSRRERIGSAAA
jgi:DNA-binding transcriptional LysR family regulator